MTNKINKYLNSLFEIKIKDEIDIKGAEARAGRKYSALQRMRRKVFHDPRSTKKDQIKLVKKHSKEQTKALKTDIFSKLGGMFKSK